MSYVTSSIFTFKGNERTRQYLYNAYKVNYTNTAWDMCFRWPTFAFDITFQNAASMCHSWKTSFPEPRVSFRVTVLCIWHFDMNIYEPCPPPFFSWTKLFLWFNVRSHFPLQNIKPRCVLISLNLTNPVLKKSLNFTGQTERNCMKSCLLNPIRNNVNKVVASKKTILIILMFIELLHKPWYRL